MTLLPLLVLMFAAVGAVEKNNVQQSIEVRVIVDSFAIKKWQTHFPTNTTAAINAFVNAVFVDVNNVYAALSSSNIKLDVRIASIEHISNEVISAETATGSGKGGTRSTLDDFAAWANPKSFTPTVDHTVLLTGLDLVSSSGNSNDEGMGFDDGMCSSDISYSVVEFQATGAMALTIAHEIGHSLGAKHDSDDNKCRADSYVMRAVGDYAVGSASTYRFSKCSVTYMISKAHPCLKSTKTAAMTSNTTLGQLYSPDQMCKMMVGLNSTFCRHMFGYNSGLAYSTMCAVLWCQDLSNDYCLSVRPPSGHVCASGKRCFLGECLTSSTAPTNINNMCPQGNTPGPMIKNSQTCSQLVTSFKGNCYKNEYRRGCCASCDSVRQASKPSCEFGDKATWCATDMTYPDDCIPENAAYCCSSCSSSGR